MGRQYIVEYSDFPSYISWNCHKRMVLKFIWHNYWELSVKMSLRDQLVCFAAFVRKTLLAVPFLLPLPNCFPGNCLHAIFAAVLKLFLPLTTSSISGAADFNESAPKLFAAGAKHLRKSNFTVLPINCAIAPNLCPRFQPRPQKNGISTYLEATIL